jgi:hypothetical protein
VRLYADHLPLLQRFPAKMFQGDERWALGVMVGAGLVIIEERFRVAFHPLQLFTATGTMPHMAFHMQDIFEFRKPIQVS